MQHLQDLPEPLRNKIFEKAFKIAEIANLNREEMNAYEKSQQAIWDNYAVQKYAKEEGKIEGLKEGEEIGMQKGEALGLRKTVINLHIAGASLDLISTATGLTFEEIKKIIAER